MSRGSEPALPVEEQYSGEVTGYPKNSPAAAAQREKQNDKQPSRAIHQMQINTQFRLLTISALEHSLQYQVCKTVSEQMKIQIGKWMRFTRTVLFNHNQEYCKDLGCVPEKEELIARFRAEEYHEPTPFVRITFPACGEQVGLGGASGRAGRPVRKR